MLNRLLSELGKVIENDPSYAFVDMLDEETLPQNSDAVLVLSQWQAALTQYRTRHHGFDSITHRWFTVENPPVTPHPQLSATSPSPRSVDQANPP